MVAWFLLLSVSIKLTLRMAGTADKGHTSENLATQSCHCTDLQGILLGDALHLEASKCPTGGEQCANAW